MNVLIRRVAFWAGLNMMLMFTAAVATGFAFFATGRAGAAPCGEDAWRWGLVYLLAGAPAFLSSYLTGLVASVILGKRLGLLKSLAIVLLIQFAVAFIALAIALWPHVVYVPPACE